MSSDQLKSDKAIKITTAPHGTAWGESWETPGSPSDGIAFGVSVTRSDFEFVPHANSFFCRVYWGSHGCDLEQGHDGPHECGCCECPDHDASNLDEDGVMCVAKPPYYGPETTFYGEDA